MMGVWQCGSSDGGGFFFFFFLLFFIFLMCVGGVGGVGGVLRAPRRSPAELRVARLIASPEGLGQVITHWAV